MSEAKEEPVGAAADPPAVDAEAFNEATFLTSINDAGTLAADIPEPDGLQRVKQLHSQIGGVVATLNDKVGKVLKKQEKEFLAAYRAHMYQVQKELQLLRTKANDAELQLKKNDKIRALEEEKEWYRKEALRLDKFSTQLKSELKFLRAKLEDIDEDRQWLERHLKTAKNGNELLRAELAVRMQASAPGAAAAAAGTVSIWQDGGGGPETSPRPTAGSGMFPAVRPSSRGGASDSAGAGAGAGYPSPPSSDRAGVATAGSGAGGRTQRPKGRRHKLAQRSIDSTSSAVATIERLQAELQAERAATKALRSATVAVQTSRGELETFFLQCVDDVRKDVSRRRTRALVAAQSKSRRGADKGGTAAKRGASSEHSTFDKSFSKDRVAIRAQEPALSDFTATDRKRVVEKLLSDDYVLEALHHLIFSGDGDADDEVELDGEPGSSEFGSRDGTGIGVAVPGVEDVDTYSHDGDAEAARGAAGSRGFPDGLRGSRIPAGADPALEEYLGSTG